LTVSSIFPVHILAGLPAVLTLVVLNFPQFLPHKSWVRLDNPRSDSRQGQWVKRGPCSFLVYGYNGSSLEGKWPVYEVNHTTST